MNNELHKNLVMVLIGLEIILAGCLVLLAFIYGIWLESFLFSDQATTKMWVIEGIKRQLIITAAGLVIATLIHIVNSRLIKILNYGSIKNSFIFSLGVFILIFLSGLAGVIIFIIQRPVLQ
ncbi:MAG: hypothetical protein OEV78_10805 [Spirochaetia bacterium]|nr:hypothetical protein [Spirochaetia bacterium]